MAIEDGLVVGWLGSKLQVLAQVSPCPSGSYVGRKKILRDGE
jgi:hypothetical protein